jgi:hypothetical protein
MMYFELNKCYEITCLLHINIIENIVSWFKFPSTILQIGLFLLQSFIFNYFQEKCYEITCFLHINIIENIVP